MLIQAVRSIGSTGEDDMALDEIHRESYRVRRVDGSIGVVISEENLRWLIGMAAKSIDVDEAWYLAANPDVAEGVRQGTVASAKAHFEANGVFEGRLPQRPAEPA